ncbi:hypothetical protein [Bifidobacterium tissieri]|uniref:hypothetical protein n=1 Tax=Bifidobacterium tissieri TaxID=1630162 RepID=UPI00123BC57C|nr:hypothetical protein [Bifidobacterium tissieri]KAA8828293.1 hypothetical protein EM849_11800 [Bifidobacterium tissieri]
MSKWSRALIGAVAGLAMVVPVNGAAFAADGDAAAEQTQNQTTEQSGEQSNQYFDLSQLFDFSSANQNGDAAVTSIPATSEERARLQAEVDKDKAIDLSKYQDNLHKTIFQQRLAHAEEVLADANSGTARVNVAYDLLYKAADRLDPVDGESGTKPEQPENPDKPGDNNAKSHTYTFVVYDPATGKKVHEESKDFKDGKKGRCCCFRGWWFVVEALRQ